MKITIKECPFNLKRLTKEVNILLISDLHYDISGSDGPKKEDHARNINQRLIDSLPIEGSDWQPDIVIIAGDLVNQNKPEGYKLFRELIIGLIEKYENLKDTIFTSPGNHDINRANLVTAFPYLHSFRKKKPKLSIENSYTRNEIIDALYTIKKESLKDGLNLLAVIQLFEKDYFENYLKQIKKLTVDGILNPPANLFTIEELKTFYVTTVLGLNIVSLNSAFFCNFSLTAHDRNNLFFINEIIARTIEILPKQGPVITFMHHPYYYLHESEHVAPRPKNLTKDTNNNFTRIAFESDLILSGHVHGDLHRPSVLYQQTYMITNGTTFNHGTFLNKSFPMTYALLKINKPLNKFALHRFRYQDTKSTFAMQDSEDSNRYYEFLRKDHVPRTDNEFDKASLLNYLLRHPSNEEDANNMQFFFYQLKLYDEWYSANKTVEIIKLHDKISIKSNDRTCIIYTINDKLYNSLISTIVNNISDSNNSKLTIYFSIDLELLQSYDNGELSKQKIEGLIKDFRNLVQASKKHFISINLLYHISKQIK